jgi:hypothetical protein
MTTMPSGYYDRTDDSKNYEKHLFTAGQGLSSAELNEIQQYPTSRIRGIGDAIFKDGDIIRDARVVVNENTGAVIAESGAVYVRGAVRGVPARNFVVSTSGLVTVGIFLVESVVTALEDPALRDPAAGTRNYQEPGSARLKVEPTWGFSGEFDADFFPVYDIENGVLRAKSAPPNLDAVTQALARYDRDSSGGTYVVAGMSVQKLDDTDGGFQVYSIAEGAARVRGFGVEFTTSRRLSVDPTPDLRYIDAEPHASQSVAAQTIALDRYPVANVTQVRITAQKTVTMTHGAYSGAQDALPDSSVLSIISVSQGGTTYVNGTDYKLTSGKVDWSLTGAEPATGSTYSVTYQYITTVTPNAVTTTSITVTGAVVGSLVLVSYNQNLPRLDRICISEDGQIAFIKGVSADYNPILPDVPENMLSLATVKQTWDALRTVIQDGVRVVPMDQLVRMSSRIDYVMSLVAQQRLESDINLREAGAKKGLFTDPFIDDSQRDQGIAQTGSIFGGELQLPVSGSIQYVDNRGPNGVSFLNKTEVSSVQQVARTGSMLVNPYMAFGVMPAQVTLNPSIDRWTDITTVWASAVTQVAWSGAGTVDQLLSSNATLQSNLRQIYVEFSCGGFGPGETLMGVTFDGLSITPVAL